MSVSLSDEEKGVPEPEFDNHNTTDQPAECAPVSAFIRFWVRILRQLIHSKSVGNAQGTRISIINEYHDPNFDPSAPALEDESPYPEVRSAVANTDDPTMPSSTLRAWVIGLLWSVLISGVNQFFYLRYPTIAVSQVHLLQSFSVPPFQC